ncbi:hypothetical protein ASPBRDRAFT_204291, partial [Aspergillus brasiliensis CBS 101740]
MDAPRAPVKHARVYQACEPCRLKKVKCNLGSVDSPADPPCARCRREGKECIFTATRKRVLPDADSHSFLLRNKRRKHTAGSPDSAPPRHDSDTARPQGEDSTQNDSTQDDHRTDSPAIRARSSEDLVHDVAYTEEDALKLLYRAGTTSTVRDVHSPRLQRDGKPSADQNQSTSPNVPDLSVGREQALEAWSHVRFIRDGLFSAEEALFYIEFFYEHLEPFTPILSVDFRPPKKHQELIEDNPILALTMLMLASRYSDLPGSGHVSRRYIIHDRLWDALQTMIMRIFWAQDSCSSATLQNKSNGLRTLGTSEALLILTEWHPRSLHFPVGGDGAHILTNKPMLSSNSFTDKNPVFWLEWSWRSDRFCWSLLGMAYTLAFELGLFDDCDDTTLGARETTNRSWENPEFKKRAYRIRQYLWISSTQMSGRLGWKYIAPYNLPEGPELMMDDTTRMWTGLATLMRKGNELLFKSRQHTKHIIQNGLYIGLLYTFQTSLQEWQEEFAKAKVTRHMRIMLAIDFNFMRVYFNSLAAQAIVESKRNGNTRLRRSNEDCVTEIIDGARSILEHVLQDLLPDGSLKFIPIRTYFRVLTATLFLLKTDHLDVAASTRHESSLSLIARVGDAFQTCSPDDAHLSSRWGLLLTTLSSTHNGHSIKAHKVAAQQGNDNNAEQNKASSNTQVINERAGSHAIEIQDNPFLENSDTLDWLLFPAGFMDSAPSDGSFEAVQPAWDMMNQGMDLGMHFPEFP